jgi:integrase
MNLSLGYLNYLLGRGGTIMSATPRLPKPRKPLTNMMLEKVRPQPGIRIELADGALPGLIFRVTPRGVKTWSVLFRCVGHGAPGKNGRPRKGAQKRYTIGTYPAWGLAEARTEAMKVLRMASLGEDPIQARFGEVKAAATFASVLADFAAQDRAASARARRRQLELWVLPKWKNKRLDAITRADCAKLLDGLEPVSTDTARRVRKYLSALFNFAAERGVIAQSPIAGMVRRSLRYVPRERVLSDAELKLIWHATLELGTFGELYRCLILQGARLRELGWAHRSWLDTERWIITVPASQYKSRRSHAIVLSNATKEIVAGLPHWGRDSFLFSADGGRNPVRGFTTAKRLLDKLLPADMEPFEIRDFRRTCKTGLAKLKIVKEVRDAAMGHLNSVGMDHVYIRYTFEDEVRAAMDAWAQRVKEIVA